MGGASTETVAAVVNRELPDLAAVVLTPSAGRDTPAGFVRAVLTELERIAGALLPGWLPEAAELTRTDPFSTAAVRAAAVERAHGSPHFAPFLAQLATGALVGRSPAGAFPLEVRCLGLSRVVAEGFGRSRLVLLVEVPPGLTADQERAFAAGAEWLAHHGRSGVWLVGPPLRAVDRVPRVPLTLRPAAPAPRPPEVVGRPHPASAAEAALEAALAAQDWSAGRVWNQSYQSHALTAPVRLDLLWPAERCVVEVDGPEHCHPARFEADRQRDVQLQLDGYAVLRFTNARISHDVGSVVHQIGTLVRARRRDISEGRSHARR
ncbi:hypothetical protein GCM10012279_35980 [Micromonospora yangpuensis]|nr:hypothetical protein GCM10012279_35980 [Micromonospora yangpuensis]